MLFYLPILLKTIKEHNNQTYGINTDSFAVLSVHIKTRTRSQKKKTNFKKRRNKIESTNLDHGHHAVKNKTMVYLLIVHQLFHQCQKN